MYCDSTPENPANSNHQCVSSSTSFPIICSQDVQNALCPLDIFQITSSPDPYLLFLLFFFYDPTAAHNHWIWVHGHSTKFPSPPVVERRMQVGAFHFEPPSMVRSLEDSSFTCADCFLPCQYRWYASQST